MHQQDRQSKIDNTLQRLEESIGKSVFSFLGYIFVCSITLIAILKCIDFIYSLLPTS